MVRLPEDKRPASWAKLRDPVCLLKRALYGHPDAGSCWEVFAKEKIRSVDFEPIPNWPGLFFRKDTSVMLSVYVDDLKAAGPQKELDAMWKELSMHIQIEPPTKLGRYLGCEHTVTEE